MRLATLFAFLAVIAAAAETPCVEVDGNEVRVRDLVAAARGFGELPADRVIAPVPAPGVRRWLRPPASDSSGEEICVTRALHPVTQESVLAAIAETRAVKGWEKVSFELVSYPQGPFPRGTIRLERGVLRPDRQSADPAAAIWLGQFEYDRVRTLAFPIRVRIRASREVNTATRDLAEGELIKENDFRGDRREAVGLSALGAARESPVLGMETSRPIGAGETIGAGDVVRPREVKRGEMVRVVVRSNQAVLRLEAKALATGGRGDWVVLENPASGRRFRGRIAGPGQILVDSTGGARAN